MKKSLIALAVMAAAGAASAQSSVTLFGIVDAAVSHYNTTAPGSFTGLTNSGYNSSRLGFRGTEDLGGGMSASFWLEGALANDNGNAAGLNFQRRSTVSLAGPWGEVRLGRDYVPTFWNDTVFDPFGTNGVGTSVIFKAETTSNTAATPVPSNFALGTIAANHANAVRANNMVAYFLPANIGGFYGQASYAWDEVVGLNNTGRYWGARLGYGSGPFNVAVAAGKTDGTSPTTAAAPKVSVANIGGQWDFGMAKLLGEYSRNKFDVAGVDTTAKGWLIGTLVPVGPGEIRFSYSRVTLDIAGPDPRSSQWAIGYVHNLSKRTALYATYARLTNKNGASLAISNGIAGQAGTINGTTYGYDLGIRHSF
jgi:predicted porin